MEIEQFLRTDEEAVDHRIHCVIFLIPASSYNNSVEIDKLKLFQNDVKQRDIPFFYVLTQFDRVDATLRNSPQNLPIHPKLATYVKDLTSQLKVDPSFVTATINYAGESCCQEILDILALRIIDKAIGLCQDRFKAQYNRAKNS
eukprot:TRINITY_DN2552_c0_g1_i2.p2 TRINITY_DN2552_c0_g1~~TRINITY_DN2552_c0_g1_i2.p2  ORF type:complete len:144 (-),score=33.51 TRINITY_DN2552_c0_g1_i2:65-496(-)